MEVFITIIEFLAVLGVVIVVHEFGHFAAMKALGIKVNEFGMGFPPRLLGIRKGETLYTLNLLPIGGFVKPEGENDSTDPRSFAAKGPGVRFIVLVAGVFMNIVLALFLLTAFFMFSEPREELRIGSVAEGSPAEQAGLLAGDFIVAANGTLIDSTEELVVNHIRPSEGREVDLLIRRDDVEQEIGVVPQLLDPSSSNATVGIGVTSEVTGVSPVPYARPPWEAVSLGAQVIWSIPGALKDAITDWLVDDGEVPFAGPVGIAQGTGEWAREFSLISLILLAGILSVSVAILNVLPIPALDGGRILFVVIEWIRRGKRIPPEKEGMVHMAGFALLIGVVLVLSYNDITRIVEGKSLLG